MASEHRGDSAAMDGARGELQEGAAMTGLLEQGALGMALSRGTVEQPGRGGLQLEVRTPRVGGHGSCSRRCTIETGQGVSRRGDSREGHKYTCTCGPAWPGTAQAHESTAHKGTAHKSTYLIMGRAVPARVPSHRPTARPTISYVCQAGPNSPKYLNVPDRPIYIQ
jgi:hypothetical protein